MESESTLCWWGRRWLVYNLSLACAGILAFVCYATVVFTHLDAIPEAEITGFTTLFQALGYLVLMCVANICFLAGPVSEKLIRPRNLDRYRLITYRLGYWFSVLLPFSVPVLLLCSVWFGSQG